MNVKRRLQFISIFQPDKPYSSRVSSDTGKFVIIILSMSPNFLITSASRLLATFLYNGQLWFSAFDPATFAS